MYQLNLLLILLISHLDYQQVHLQICQPVQLYNITIVPSRNPTNIPTEPTIEPTDFPSQSPTHVPSDMPTPPTFAPTMSPTDCDPHITTFDGLYYHYMGHVSYDYVTACNINVNNIDTGLPAICYYR